MKIPQAIHWPFAVSRKNRPPRQGRRHPRQSEYIGRVSITLSNPIKNLDPAVLLRIIFKMTKNRCATLRLIPSTVSKSESPADATFSRSKVVKERSFSLCTDAGYFIQGRFCNTFITPRTMATYCKSVCFIPELLHKIQHWILKRQRKRSPGM